LPGTSWQQQLEDAIAHHSTAFAIYLSAAGAEHWVRIEVRAALDRLITDGRNGIAYPFIPVIAADAGDIARLPRFAQQYQGVSLQDEQGLQKLIGVVLGSEPAVPVPLVDEPFRGLDAFEADQAHLFFGRERETHELIDRLRRNGLIIVVGDSGSGKSSVVKAGVVPGFREGLVADPLAPRPPAAAWHVVQMRPLNNPLCRLRRAV
jgi:TIR domain